ncbi:MAG: MFS transporter [Acidobacteria bacterium]|nr:MFS transporter [Acidobacteriota bacterium]
MATGANDRVLISAAAFVRAVSTGFIGVALGLYLARAGFSAATLGAVISAGLAGAAVAAALATVLADRVGRRRFLFITAATGALGTAAFAFAASPAALMATAFVGMLNGMGRDRGAALILEQAALPSTTTDTGRTRAFAWYTMLQDVGHGLGALLAGVPAAMQPGAATGAGAYRAALLVCASLAVGTAFLYLRLRSGVEHSAGAERQRLTPRSRAILLKISALFCVDSLAGGFLTTSLLSYFFFERFGASEMSIGALFFGARLLNAVSHLGAAWLASRIGLVNTMVFTHIPSSVLLATVAFAPSFAIAAALFLLREGLVEMDVPTRQSYVLAVVEPAERTVASGITNLVRLAAWAVAPALAGTLMQAGSLHLPLVIGAAMKIAYDLLLWSAFRSTRPPEEAAVSQHGAARR